MNDLEKTVNEFLFGECSRTLLAELASTFSPYWQSVEQFVDENSEEYVADLTQKQKKWLYKIKQDLLDEVQK